jgi:hypothetical protein
MEDLIESLHDQRETDVDFRLKRDLDRLQG